MEQGSLASFVARNPNADRPQLISEFGTFMLK